MDEATARIAYPLIEHVLCLRDRLENGEFLEIDFEQTALKDMLRDAAESPGDVVDASAATAPEIVFLDKEAPQPFFGIRYALVCWLDEFLGRFSSWVPGSWQENTLERALFGSNDGSWKFWEQARLAEERGLYDALGVFYLSVMLGFRGKLASEPDRLRDWARSTRIRLEKNSRIDWLDPPELEPISSAPPLRARETLQRWVVVAGSVLLLLVPVATFMLVRQFGH